MDFFSIDSRLETMDKKALAQCEETFKKIDEITEYNQRKVLSAL